MNPDVAGREEQIAAAVAELAHALAGESDAIDVLGLVSQQCVDLFKVAAAGVVVADPHGYLRIMACSDERPWLIELLQAQNDGGPCLDSYRSGRPVSEPDLKTARDRWTNFTTAALDADIRGSHAIPLRLRHALLGALGLFSYTTQQPDEADTQLGQALTDIAALSLLQPSSRELNQVPIDMAEAIRNRSVTEQAQGILAERYQIDLQEAFKLLRNYAREHDRRLSAVAHDVIDGTLTPPISPPDPRGPPSETILPQ